MVTATVNGLAVAVTVSGSTVVFASPVTGLVLVTVCRTTTTTYTSLQVADTDADTVNATGSTAPLVVFGGQGNDKISTGSGSDIVLGDRGRVSFDGPTTTATRLGNGGADDRTDGLPRPVISVTTVDPRIGGDDTIVTGAGNDVALGGAGKDRIDTGLGNDLVVADHGFVDWTSLDNDASDIDKIWSTDTDLGGNDTVTTGDGDDVVLGGPGADTIHAGTATTSCSATTARSPRPPRTTPVAGAPSR